MKIHPPSILIFSQLQKFSNQCCHAKIYSTLITAQTADDRRCFRCFEVRLAASSESPVEPLRRDLEAFIQTMSLTDNSEPGEYKERLHTLLDQLNDHGNSIGTYIFTELSHVLINRTPLANLVSQAMLHIVKQLKAHHVPRPLILNFAAKMKNIPEDSQAFIVHIIAEAHRKGVISAVEIRGAIPALLKVSHSHDILPQLELLSTEIIDIDKRYSSIIVEAFLAGIELDRTVGPPQETINIVSYIAKQQPHVMLPPSTDLLVTLVDAFASTSTINFVCDTLRIMAKTLESAAFIGRHGIELRLSEIVCVAIEGQLVLTAAQCLLDLGSYDPCFVDEGNPDELFNRMTEVLEHCTFELSIIIIGILEILFECKQLKPIKTHNVEILQRYLFEKLHPDENRILPFARFSIKLLISDKLPMITSPEHNVILLEGCVKARQYSERDIEIESIVRCTERIIDACLNTPNIDLSKLIESTVAKVFAELNRTRMPWKNKDWILLLISKCVQIIRTIKAPMKLLNSCLSLAWRFLQNCIEPAEGRAYIASLVCYLDSREDPLHVTHDIERISDECLTPAEVYYILLLAKMDKTSKSNNAKKSLQQLKEILNGHSDSWGAACVSKVNIIKRLLVERPDWAEVVVNALEAEHKLLVEMLDADCAHLILPYLVEVMSRCPAGEVGQLIATANDLLFVAARMDRPPDKLPLICVTLAKIYQDYPLLTIASLLIRLIKLESNADISRQTIERLSDKTTFIDKLIEASTCCTIRLELLYILSPVIEARRACLSWVELKELWHISAQREQQEASNIISLIVFETLKNDSVFLVQPQPTIGEFREAWMRLLESTSEWLFRSALNFLHPSAPNWMWEQAMFELLANLQEDPKTTSMPKVFTALLLSKCVSHQSFTTMKWGILAAPWLAAARNELPEHLWNDCANGLREINENTNVNT